MGVVVTGVVGGNQALYQMPWQRQVETDCPRLLEAISGIVSSWVLQDRSI